MFDCVQSVLRNRWVQTLVALALLVLAGILFYLISPLLTPLFLAMLVAYLLNPVVEFFERHGIRRSVTATMLALLSVVALIALPLFLMPQIIEEADDLATPEQPEDAQARVAIVDRAMGWLPLRSFGRMLDLWERDEAERLTNAEVRAGLRAWVGRIVTDNIEGLTERYASQIPTLVQRSGATLGEILRYLWGWVVAVIAFLVSFSVFAFATGYLLVSFPNLLKHARELIPMRYRDKTLSVLRRIDDQIRGFVQGQLTVALVEAVVYCIGLSISGVPFAIVIGILAGLLSFIPYLGVVTALTISVLLTLVEHGIDWHLLGVVLTFGAVQSVEETVLRPLIVGDKIGLHPVWVMAAFLVFGSAFGFVGVLLAVPLAAILKVLVLEGYEYYRHTKLYAPAGPSDVVEAAETPSEALAPVDKPRESRRRRKREKEEV